MAFLSFDIRQRFMTSSAFAGIGAGTIQYTHTTFFKIPAFGDFMLTDTRIRTAKPQAKAYKLTDGHGLHLLVNPIGSKLWQLRYRFSGKEKLTALGPYPEVSLAQAREQRDVFRKQLRDGQDPVAGKRMKKLARLVAQESTFAVVTKSWFDSWSKARSPRHADYVMRRLEQDVFPVIGKRPVAEIEATELVLMLKKIEKRGALDIAKLAHQTVGQIFRYAIAHGLAKRNPASEVRPSDVLASRRASNYARIDEKFLPDLLLKIDAYQGKPVTRQALKLMTLTFVRTSELIKARWEEFDLEAAQWRIPAERMKMKTPHIVPLSRQAVQVLKVLQTATGDGTLLFPGERRHDQPMSNNTILKALERMGFKGRMTGHGFRGLASTILHEQGYDHAHIKLQLAHQERNHVSASYNHAQYLAQRAKLMQKWADYLDRCQAT